MPNRTPPELWGALFNFAGRGVIHIELFEEFILAMAGPTSLEIFAAYLLLRGTIANRPAAGAVPEGAEYYATDTGERWKAISAAWVADGAAGGGGSGASLAAGKLAGRATTSAAGVYEQIELGTGLSMTGATINAAGGGSGADTLISTVDIATATDTITFSSLDGDADGEYEIRARIISGAGADAQVQLRPNGATTNLTSDWCYWATATLNQAQASVAYLNSVKPSAQTHFNCTMLAKTGANRRYFAQGNSANTDFTPPLIGEQVIGQWADSSANITSLVLHGTQANTFGVGTSVSLYKRAR